MSSKQKSVSGRRRFLRDSAGILGSIAASGAIVETTHAWPLPAADAGQGSVRTADVPSALVKIREKNHFVPVKAWLSDEVVKMVGANTLAKRQALVSRLLHEHETHLDVITKGGTHTGELRFYIGVPHEVKAGEMHDMPDSGAGGACVMNYVCVTWDDPKKECCVRWKCCGLA